MVVEFGPFAADIQRGELLKHGKRLRLRDQPFQILAALIEKRGDIVTREELRCRLWTDRVFVEFEAGLNTAISRLRQALNDPAHAPRFIETVPKRGYRFIGMCQSALNRAPAAPLEHRPIAEAHKAYLKGHYLIKRHTPPNAQRALEHFREAIRLDPAFVLPYHGAAIYYMMAAVMGELPPAEALRESEDLLQRGLSFDDSAAMLHNTIGMQRMFQWRWTEAEAAYRRAINIEPANPHVRMMYALLCSLLGRHDQALHQAEMAVEFDTLDPMTNFHLVQCCYFAGRFEQCIKSGYSALELAPEFPYSRWYVACSLLALGRREEAWQMALDTRRLDNQPLNEGRFGYIAAAVGRKADALAVLRELEIRRELRYSPALPIAWIYLGLGHTDTCLEWLETAVRENEPYLPSIAVSQVFDCVRDDPRFRGILAQIANVPEAS
jgi:DNA-binding winged helix-turn-helix (wHTH) protein